MKPWMWEKRQQIQGCQHWMRVQSETCDGRPLPAYKVAQVPKKLMSGGGLRHFFFKFLPRFAKACTLSVKRNITSSDWMFLIGILVRSVSSFCDFWKMTFHDLTAFYPFWKEKMSCFFRYILLRGIKAYLCPNIIYFDSVDFSEPCPEEVISFFWRSVYVRIYTHIITKPIS